MTAASMPPGGVEPAILAPTFFCLCCWGGGGSLTFLGGGGGCEANLVLKLPARFAVLQITGTRA